LRQFPSSVPFGKSLEEEIDMTRTSLARRGATLGAGLALTLSLAACGGNLGGDSQPATAEEFPNGPVSMLIGQDPGGSTDLIGRAIADEATKELGVPITVENRPGANGALAAQELAGEAPDGQTIMVMNGSLIYITPLAVAPEEAIDLNNYEVITGISQDDYVLVASPSSGFKTVQDIVAVGRPINFGTTGVGTGSQLSSELLFSQAGVQATAVPFDGGAPTLTAVLGNQVDVASIQLGEAISQIKAGAITPVVTFAKERVSYLPDVPTATEAGFPVEVQQSRALVAPKGTPAPVVEELRAAAQKAFGAEAYQQFNTERLLTPNEVDGATLRQQWNDALENYRGMVQQYGIDLGGQQ
jgi:tripartite-type tricarboxylate transporter receptor subunit TctC